MYKLKGVIIVESILESSQQIISRIEEILTHDKEKNVNFNWIQIVMKLLLGILLQLEKRTRL